MLEASPLKSIIGAFLFRTLTKEVIIGIIVSFATGVLAIKFLLNYIKKHDFSVFAFYRVILALVVFVKLIFFK